MTDSKPVVPLNGGAAHKMAQWPVPHSTGLDVQCVADITVEFFREEPCQTPNSALCRTTLTSSCLSFMGISSPRKCRPRKTHSNHRCPPNSQRGHLHRASRYLSQWRQSLMRSTIIDFPNTGITYNGGWCSATIPR